MSSAQDPTESASLEDWFHDFQLATTIDRDERTVAGRPMGDYHLVARVAVSGPRDTQEAQVILADQELRRLLQAAWDDDAPNAALRAQLEADPYGRALLSLAPAVGSTDSPQRARRGWMARLDELAESVRSALTPLQLVEQSARAVTGSEADEASEPGTAVYHATDDDGSPVGITLERFGQGDAVTYVASYFNEFGDPDLHLVIEWNNGEVEVIVVGSDDDDLTIAFDAPTDSSWPVRVAVAKSVYLPGTE